jgi:hypothetical protein
MHAVSGAIGFGKLEFGRRDLMRPSCVRKPLAERILLKCPRLASVLAAVGAKGAPRAERVDSGTLATMMAASGSIDYAGRGRKYYRFYIRPMG